MRSLRLSRSQVFIVLTALSLLAHGAVLGLPWPEVELSQEPIAPAESAEEAAIDVAILPSDVLNQPNADVEAPTAKPVERAAQPPAAAKSPELSRSPQPPPPKVVERSSPPPAPVEAPESSPPEPQLPPLPEDGTEADSVADLPVESGLSNPDNTDVSTPPTLEERLQDVTAYHHDGTKNLGNDAIMVAQSWAVEGQIYPSKAEPMELPYELGNTCLDNPPLRGTLMVVQDATGSFVRGPEVISSTGYDILDEQAEERVRSHVYNLPDQGETKAYSVDVVVLYPADCL